jgi:hypothetical protein
MGRWRTSNVGAEFRNLGRRSVGLGIRVIVVRPLMAQWFAFHLMFDISLLKLDRQTSSA